MEKVIFTLKEGEISQVFESSYGYHIFRLDKRFAPELMPEEEAVPIIEGKILNQKINEFMSAYLEGLISSMDWTAYYKNLPFVYQRNEHD